MTDRMSALPEPARARDRPPRRLVRQRLPPASMRSARLTPRGVGMAVTGGASIVGAYATGRSELLYLGLLLVLLPLIAALFARFRRLGIVATRTFTPAIVSVGQPATVELTVTNSSGVPLPALTWRDHRSWAAGGNATGTLPPLTARHGRGPLSTSSARVRYELVAARRGLMEIGPMSVVLADPFGLATGEVTVGGTDPLVVTPKIAVLPDNGLAIQASEGTSMLVRRAIGGEDDLSTREYRTGDALRRVHWRATARHGELMVRQEEPRSHAEARIIVDTRRSGYDDAISSRKRSESRSFEAAISLAASLALHLARSGFQAEIVETARGQLASVASVEPFLITLATIGLSDDTGGFPSDSPLQAASRPDRAHGSVFAVIASADTETVDRLVLQRQSFDLAVVFVIGRTTPPQSERLRRAGWLVLPVHPDDTAEASWHAVAAQQGARHGR